MDEAPLQGLNHVRAVRSARPRAKIKSLQAPPLPNGYWLITAADVPGDLYPQMLTKDLPVLADGRVNYVGEAICLVVGPDREEVWRLCQEVRVEYEDIAPILTLEDAKSGVAPPLHGTDNVYLSRGYERGGVDEAFARAARTFEDTYRTGYQDHLYLETQRMSARWDKGRLVITGPFQITDAIPRVAAAVAGMRPEDIRAKASTIGGGFGGKIETPVILAAQTALAARVSGQDVLMEWDRREDLSVSTKRHPSQTRIRTALDQEGRIAAMDLVIDLQAGAYTLYCPIVLDIALKMAVGAYRVPALRVKSSVYATNNLMPGAMRGFGALQAIFAVETHLSRLARELGRDPLDFKADHALRKGDLTCTGGVMRQEVKIPQIIESLERRSGYRQKRRQWTGQSGRYRKGIGAALYAFGAPHTVGSGYRRRPRPLSLAKTADGRVEIRTTIVEIGQGIQTTFPKIAARVLGLPLNMVSMPMPDTDRDPPTLGTGASLGIVLFGKTVERLAHQLKERWDEAPTLEVTADYLEPEELRWDEEKVCGDSFHVYSWGGLVVEVSVDTLTGQVEVTGLWAAHDIGQAIDERICLGQVDGGVVQGLGLGMMEKLENPGGFLQQTSLSDYCIPTALDVPAIDQEFIPNPYDWGPFGAKSVGEMPIVGGPPAVVEAIAHACGVSPREIPLTPERLMALLHSQEAGS